MNQYDRAITIFSPDGHLFQVEYAMQAVRKGSTTLGVCGKDCVVIATVKRSVTFLQDDRPVRKISCIDDHVMISYAGLCADARILFDKARVECRAFQLVLEDPVSLHYIAKFVANVQQAYTVGRGRRPFGVTTIVGGIDQDGTPKIFRTEPSGAYYQFQGIAIGRSDKDCNEFLEQNYKDDTIETEAKTLRLAIEALMLVAPPGAQNMEVATLKLDKETNQVCYRTLKNEEIGEIIKEINAEKAAAKAKADAEDEARRKARTEKEKDD